MEFIEFWYRYRPDLYKKVTVFGKKPRFAQNVKEKAPPNLAESADMLDGLSAAGASDEESRKLPGNIRRSAVTIEELALCNDWDLFFTGTLSPAKYPNRLDLDTFREDFTRLIRRLRERLGCGIHYLLVPELHKNRSGWHMHGLLKGLPLSELRPFTASEKLPAHLIQSVRAGRPVYDWPVYRNRFGWTDLEPVRSRDAAARYVAKYIHKGWDSTAAVLPKGKQLYYCSEGLKRRQRLEDFSTVDMTHDFIVDCISGAADLDDLILKLRSEGNYQAYVDNAAQVVLMPPGGSDAEGPDGGVVPLSLQRALSYDYDYGRVRWYTTTPDTDSIQV